MVLLIPNMAPEAQLYGRMTFWLDTGCLMYESANSFHESEETILLSGFSHTSITGSMRAHSWKKPKS